MKENKGMTVDELYNHITSVMSPEEALKKLLAYQIEQYDALKNMKDPGDVVNPVYIIACASLDLGWQLAVEDGDPDAQIRGLVVGTEEYLNELFHGKENTTT